MPGPVILGMNLTPPPGQSKATIGCPHDLLVHWQKDAGMDPIYAGVLEVRCACGEHTATGGTVIGTVNVPDMVPNDITSFVVSHTANQTNANITARLTVDNVPGSLTRTVDVDCGMMPPAAAVAATVAAAAGGPAVTAAVAAAAATAAAAAAVGLISLDTPAPGFAVIPGYLTGKYVSAAGDAVSVAVVEVDGTTDRVVAELLATTRPDGVGTRRWGVNVPATLLDKPGAPPRVTIRLTLWKAGVQVISVPLFALVRCPHT